MLTAYDIARREHEQAKRHLRRIQQERAIRSAIVLDQELSRALARVEHTLSRLRAAELATPPGGDGDRQNETDSNLPGSKGTEHAARL